MKDITGAERYAEALFEIAWKNRKDREYEEALRNFSLALQMDPEIEKFLLNPAIGYTEKGDFIRRVYSDGSALSTILIGFFMLLLEKNRFGLVHEIADVFKKLADRAQGEGTAEIQSAVALEPQAEAAICSKLEKIAGYKLRITKSVDPSLVGGVVVKMDYKIMDGSIKNEIHCIQEELTAARFI